jgi:hypothetical protein
MGLLALVAVLSGPPAWQGILTVLGGIALTLGVIYLIVRLASRR